MEKQEYDKDRECVTENILGDELAKIYTIKSCIHENTKSTVYKAEYKGTLIPVVIKFDEKGYHLENEYEIYKMLKGEPGFSDVRFFESNTRQKCGILILDYVGDNLWHLLRKDGLFSYEKIKKYSYQMIERIRIVHERGIVHRDIKPENFTVDEFDQVFLIDFGLSSTFRLENGEHIPFTSVKSFKGTPTYASLNIVNKVAATRRDDLISLGYTFITLMTGTLLWKDDRPKNIKDLPRYYKLRKSISNLELTRGLPKEILKYMDYVDNLGFYEKPDYEYLQKLLK